MKTILTSLLALSVTGVILTDSSHGASIVSITDTEGAPTSVSILPGGTFTFSLSLSAAPESTIGLTYFLEAPGAGSGRFELTSRVTTGTTFTDLTTSNALALTVANRLLDPRNNNDLGGTVNDLGTPNTAGSYFIATFTLAALPAAPLGVYTIQLSSNSVALDPDFNEIPITSSPYTVTIAPEPTSAALLMVGLVSLASRRRRQAK